MLEGKRVAILIGPKFHDEETTVPLDFLHEDGAKVDLIAPDKSTMLGKYGRVSLTADETIQNVHAQDYDALIIPGGGAPEQLRVIDAVLDFVRDFQKSGRPIGTICHGPQVLISAGLLKGITLTCYVGIRDDVLNAGARYVDKEVCVDGQFISSRKPEDLQAFMETFTQSLSVGFLNENEQTLQVLDALAVAIGREKGAQEFYLGVAENIQTESVKNKFKYLATVESGHFEQLSELYEKVSGGNKPKIDVADTEIGRHTVSPDIKPTEAIELAMNAEQKAYDFYRHAALKAQNKQAIEMFEYLAAEELEHKRYLSIDMATMEGGQAHFQWATFWDIPPGMEDFW